MKQLLFLLLFPCLAMAQYQGNANQKITLGEQTTADGLVWRGLRADTTNKIVPFSDTSAYIILDTVEKTLWLYKAGQVPKWQQVGGSGGVSVSSFSAGTTGLTPSTATTGAVTLGGTLAVTNGGTNTGTLKANKVMVGNGTSGVLTPTDIHWDNSNSLLGVGETTLSTFKLTVKGAFPILFNTTSTANTLTYGGTRFFRNTDTLANGNGFQYSFNDANGNAAEYGYFGGYIIDNTVGSTDGGFIFAPTLNNTRTEAMRILNNGEMWLGYTTDNGAYKLQVKDSVYVGGNISASAYTTRSDYDLKDEIQNINYGLNEVMQMQPVKYTYKSNGSSQLGFIAQDLGVITPEVVSFEDKMSVYYNALIPILTKAIQEQQALIKALEQRIINLENK